MSESLSLKASVTGKSPFKGAFKEANLSSIGLAGGRQLRGGRRQRREQSCGSGTGLPPSSRLLDSVLASLETWVWRPTEARPSPANAQPASLGPTPAPVRSHLCLGRVCGTFLSRTCETKMSKCGARSPRQSGQDRPSAARPALAAVPGQ